MNGASTGSGSWTVSSGALLNFGSTTSTGIFALSGPVTGAGGVVFSGGTGNVTANYNITGSTTVASGGTANWLSPATVASVGALAISGGTANFSSGNPVTANTLTLSNGNLAGTDAITISGATIWTGGNMCTTVTSGSCAAPAGAQGSTTTSGGITFSSVNQLQLNGRVLSTAGTTAWTSSPGNGDLLMQNGATINNTGLWDIQNDSYVYLLGGASNTFNNAGTFQKSGGTTATGTSGVYGTDGTFKNTGQVIAKAGNMNFLGTFAQTAGTTSLAGGMITTTTNPLSIQGGSVIGVGNVNGGINNTAGAVAPGTITPTVTTGNIAFGTSTSGTYAQSGSGAYNVKIGGTAAGSFDTLTATGAVTLGGALNVTLVNSFSPVVGNTFTIITAGSVTNKFGSANLPALTAGLGWQVSYNPTTVILSVTSVSSPVANLNPASLPFPNTIVNTPATIQKVQLQNTGTAPLTITSIVPTGADAANYSYTVDATKPCPISPATLANGASCMLDIGFTPLSGGTHNSAQITVTDNSGNVTGSTQTVALSGTGITLTSITVAPATNNLPQGVTSQYSATGFYSDGSNQNLTTTATWASSNPTVASISNTSGSQGQAKGLTGGSTFITATQNSVTSNQATLNVTTATHLVITAPGSATSGTPFNAQVYAEDAFNQVVTGYTGTVHFTSSDASAVLPANTTLTNGTANLSFTLKTQGTQTITGTDTVTSTITGTSGSISVGSGLATHFVVTAPGIATSGTAFSVNVTALDQFNNVAAGYTGTVHFTSSDAQALLPANAKLSSGSGNFQVTLKTVGSETVTATDTVTATITGVSNAITVSSGTATHFLVVAPPSVSAGGSFNVTVAALDQFNNPVPGYTGTVHITSSDAAAVLPANATLTSGTGLFAVTLKTLGSQTVTATDTVTSTITGSASITVSSIAPTLLSITVTPANPSLAANGIQAFIAIGQYSDGSTSNLTSSVAWSSGTTSVATITAGGVATGVSAGGSTISATLGGITGSTLLTVTATTAHAYVGDVVSANCCLDVIDISTNTIVKQIPITNVNEPLGITPDQSRVYIPDNVLSALDVIDTTTNTLVNTLPVGNGTTAVVITPNGKFGYVADFGDNNIPIFNVATNAVVGSVPIGFPAGWISITPDGAWVYAGSAVDGRVAVVSTATNTLSSTFTIVAPQGQPAPGCITGPTFNPEGTLGYFTLTCVPKTATSGTVSIYSIPSNTFVANVTVGADPFQSAITPDGTRLYVANAISNNVSVINTATNAVIATIPMPGHAESIAVTPDGAHVYVGNTNAATVSVIQTSTNTVTASIATTIPFGIVIASPPAASAATTLTLTPPNLIFAAQVDGTPSAPQTITVKNPGATPVTLTSITLTGPNIGDFHLTNGCPNPPSTLGAGASCNLQVAITPTTNGARTALLSINSTNGITPSTQSAPLSGTGISLVSIAITPANLSVSATNTVQFTATGTYSDNSTQNITNSVGWTSSSTGIATINASGLATGVAAGGPITITATSGNIFGTTQLTVTPLAITFPLNVTLIGTGTGTVTDNFGSINCVDTAGVISGTCSANYPSGTVATLTASPTAPSTFGGWLQACSGTAGCSVTMNSAQSVTASIVPPPQPVAVNFTPGTNVSGMAAYDCPSNPNPSPGNPCLDPNAHANSVSIGQVITPFTLTVVATEVPPLNGNGICENGLTPQQDLDCRFKSFFTYQTNANGDTIVPLCYPYANGNCVVYSVYYQTPGKEPDQSMYVGPITWNISFNNDKFSPPAPWAGGTPQLYYDPSNFVVPNSPYGTDCTTPMLVGNPGVPTNPAIYCQFVFDITTLIDPTKKVDFLIGGKSKNFSDTIVAIPPVFAPVVTVTTTPDSATVTAGSPIGFTIAVSNSAAATANNVSLNTPLPGGTNVNWTISPAYTGQGTCSIAGAQGSQVLNCAFGTMSPSTSLSVHIQSASSAAGTAISPSTVLVGTQQLLSVGSIVVQPITVTFSGLTASQTIPAGTSSVTLAGVIGNGTQFVPSGEKVSITINGVTQTATVGSNGAFSLQFPTTGIPVSGTAYPITYSYAGDSLLSTATNSSTTLTVTPQVVTFPLNVTLIGTGTGTVTDNFGSINCVDTAGVISGTCSANYPSGTVATLTASPTAPSTFGGWLQACSGTAGCSVTMNSAQSVTASIVPPPQPVAVNFTPGTNVSGMAAYDCPSNPNPSPGNPCLDPNAHANSVSIGQVITPFTLTVVATEVPPLNGNGICENGLTPQQDLDCRFKSFFTYQTNANGDTIVPLCYPYANGNCVVYSVYYQTPGKEPDQSMYVGPITWNISFNNDKFSPPAPWAGGTPQLYYDPSNFVVPNSPYGTDCTTPMLVGNPGMPTNPAIYCQFVFDITTLIDPTKKVDFLIGGKSKNFSDTIVAIPPVFAPVVTVTTTPDSATVTAGSPIGFTIAVSNSAAATANNVSLNTPLPGGTNVNWTISPAYTGQGTCSIAGAQGSQVLNCAFGTMSPSASLSVHIQSASSAAGTAISPSTVLVGTQQLLSVGSIVVQPITVTFSGLTASQTIPVGTSAISLAGVIGNGTQFVPSGEKVSITINGVTQTATVGSNGAFSLQFPTAGIPGSATPYPVTYSYAGDSLLSTAANSTTTLTVVSPPPGVNLSATLQSATVDVSGNYVFTVRITNSGGATANAATIKTAVLTTVIGTTRVNTVTTTKLPANLGNIASLSSVTTTLTFPASAGPPNTAGAISLGFGFTGGSASSVLRATLP